MSSSSTCRVISATTRPTGLAHTKGERVFLIDSDLEEEPEYLIGFSEQLEDESCDVVYGVQERRKGGWFERWSGQWFYRFFKALTGLALPENIVTARLMTRRYVDALLRHEEREVFIAGLWHITGFDQQPRTITKHDTSKTTYTLFKKLSLLVDSVTSFSNAPPLPTREARSARRVVRGRRRRERLAEVAKGP